MDWLPAAKDGAQVVAYVAGAAAALISMWQYRRNSQRERAHWIYELYRRFWDQPTLRKMRERVDAADIGFLQREENDVPADFDDYLNFFEFIGFLRKSGELKSNEIAVMFDYSLRQIGENSAIRRYLSRYGYEQLNALLNELRYSVKQDGHK